MTNLVYKATKEDEGRYVKEILQQKMKLSSRLIRKIKITGEIMLNGRKVHVRERVGTGDVVGVNYPEERSYFEPQNIPLDVVYEDDDLLIVNKQPGLIVHPTYNFHNGTLANAVTYYMNQKNEQYKLRFVNRLDMYTSGLLIVGKNAYCQDFISRRMQTSDVKKIYKAIVHGITEEAGTIDLPIDKDPDHKARRFVTAGGYPSVTHYKRLEFFPGIKYGQLEGFSLLEIKPDTGRTHQIRVHMTHLGHPLLGDELYAQLYGYYSNPEWMPRQALHAAHLEFEHPVSRKLITADAPMPEDMNNCLKYLRVGADTLVNNLS